MPQLLCHSGNSPPWYPINRGMGGLQNWSGQFGEDKSPALMEMNTIPWLSTSTSRQKLDPHIVTQQRN